MSSSVFLSNVDDYLAPSQACVNPLFGGKKEEKKEETASKPKANVVIPRQHRRKRQQQLQQQQQEDDSNKGAKVLMDIASTPSPSVAPSFSMEVPAPSIDKTANNNPALENNANNTNSNIQDDPIVKASIADCLACSGCVTTAETVLLEERHSLDLLRERFLVDNNNNTSSSSKQQQQLRRPMVMTISPAAWADLSRHLDLPTTNNNNMHQQQFTTLLSQTFSNLALVMDGNVPLEWSLQEAAREFCRVHNSKANLVEDAMQVDDTSQDMDIDDATATTASLPLVASSCPAVVCLVEKSIHPAVPHLSTTKSAMSMAGAYWRNAAANNNVKKRFFHVAVMPCHDKKLEASRASSSAATSGAQAPKEQDVDLVITTSECLQLLQEAQAKQQKQVGKDEISLTNGENGNNTDSRNSDDGSMNSSSNNSIRSLLLASPPAPCILADDKDDEEQSLLLSRLDATVATTASNTDATTRTAATLITVSSSSCSDAMDETTASTSTSSPFVYGSGGYADYIFRYACRELYSFTVDANTNPWKSVTSTASTAAAAASSSSSSSRIRKSVRVAASQQRNRQRDYYQAILYRHITTGEYSLTTSNNDHRYEPVLRFAIAYGMQTLQRVLKPFHDDDNKGDSPVQQQSSFMLNGNGHKRQQQPHAYDYIEAMACPSGCLNGGGQLPLSSAATPTTTQTKATTTAIISARETPTQTRQRVQMTQAQFAVAPSSSNTNQQQLLDSSAIMTMFKRIPEAQRHATYHAVAPLQLSMGAGAGVAVQDIQW